MTHGHPGTSGAKMSSTNSIPDHASWTPEQLMRDYHGELKRELFVRCMEWYTNAEVEAKINAGRADGSKIRNPNSYAEFKRNMDNTALRDGFLPTEFRLQFDKRRLLNFEARFGSESGTVRQLRTSVRKRDAIAFPTLSANPSLKELEAARPDNGKNLQKGRETKDYWFKFLAATQKFSQERIRTVYSMAPTTVDQEFIRARSIVARLKEIEQIERAGGSVDHTYCPPRLLLPGQQIYTHNPSRRLVVILKTNQSKHIDNFARVCNTSSTSSTSSNASSLLSVRTKYTLSRLQNELVRDPSSLPPLPSLTCASSQRPNVLPRPSASAKLSPRAKQKPLLPPTSLGARLWEPKSPGPIPGSASLLAWHMSSASSGTKPRTAALGSLARRFYRR